MPKFEPARTRHAFLGEANAVHEDDGHDPTFVFENARPDWKKNVGKPPASDQQMRPRMVETNSGTAATTTPH